jgi:FkbM family methyltransferase
MPKNVTPADYLLARAGMAGDALAISGVAKNWYDLVLFKMGVKKRVEITLISGEKYRIANGKDYRDFWTDPAVVSSSLNLQSAEDMVEVRKSAITVRCGKRSVALFYKGAREFGITAGMVRETFVDNQYGRLDVKDGVVVDIGGNIGDSAIYFALKGAGHVYSYEPYPYLYRMEIRNVRGNHLGGRITVLNEGCGAERAGISVASGLEESAGGALKRSKGGKRVGITTLSDIVERYRLKDATLKIDCEGCEYGILLKSGERTLRSFKQIAMEYHYGYIDLKSRLESAGFRVVHARPRMSYHPELESPNMLSGLLYAKRVG